MVFYRQAFCLPRPFCGILGVYIQPGIPQHGQSVLQVFLKEEMLDPWWRVVRWRLMQAERAFPHFFRAFGFLDLNLVYIIPIPKYDQATNRSKTAGEDSTATDPVVKHFPSHHHGT